MLFKIFNFAEGDDEHYFRPVNNVVNFQNSRLYEESRLRRSRQTGLAASWMSRLWPRRFIDALDDDYYDSLHHAEQGGEFVDIYLDRDRQIVEDDEESQAAVVVHDPVDDPRFRYFWNIDGSRFGRSHSV